MENTPENLPENQPQPSTPELTAQPVTPKACAKCGTLNAPDARFCLKCGQAFPNPAVPGKKYCKGCGTVNEETSQYCWKCGLKLPELTAAGAPLKYGGFWIRLGAFLIDSLILSTITSIISIPFYIPFMRDMMSEMEIWIYNVEHNYYSTPDMTAFFDLYWQFLGTFVILYLIQTLIQCVYYTVGVGKWGTTIGKAACGLKIIRTDGSRVSYWRAFARYWAHLLNGFTWGLTYIIIAFHGKKQGLHDMICDTLVVKK